MASEYEARILVALGWEPNGDRWTRSGVAPEPVSGSSYALSDVSVDESEALRSAVEEVVQISAWSNTYWSEVHGSGRTPSPEEVARADSSLSRRLGSLEAELATSRTERETQLASRFEKMRLAWLKARHAEGTLRGQLERRDARVRELEQMLAMKCSHGTPGHASQCTECVAEWMTSLSKIHERVSGQ